MSAKFLRCVALAGLLLGVAAMALGLLAGSASAAPYSNAPTLAVGVPCADRPSLAVGDNFAPGEVVTITLSGAVDPVGSVVADAHGHFQIAIVYPGVLSGPHRLTAIGATGDRAGTDIDVHACSGPSTVSATLTVTARPSSTSVVTTPTATNPPTTTSTRPSGPLASTGVAVLLILSIGLVLVVGGAVILSLARRRSRAH